jgi:S1-C subfamily serine protease
MFELKKKTLSILFVLIIGGLGGVLANQFLLPYLATLPGFSRIGFIRHAGNGTTIINPTEKIIITENIALEEAIDRINPCLVAVRSERNGKIISQGTGFIITSDGLIITANDLLPTSADQYLVYRGENSFIAQAIERDWENNLALLKIETSNLPVVSLADLDELRLGQRIVLIGLEPTGDKILPFVNLGIIREINSEILKINLTEENRLANGSPLIGVNGEVIGLNLVDYKGLIKTVPANKIKEFIGL